MTGSFSVVFITHVGSPAYSKRLKTVNIHLCYHSETKSVHTVCLMLLLSNVYKFLTYDQTYNLSNDSKTRKAGFIMWLYIQCMLNM